MADAGPATPLDDQVDIGIGRLDKLQSAHVGIGAGCCCDARIRSARVVVAGRAHEIGCGGGGPIGGIDGGRTVVQPVVELLQVYILRINGDIAASRITSVSVCSLRIPDVTVTDMWMLQMK